MNFVNPDHQSFLFRSRSFIGSSEGKKAVIAVLIILGISGYLVANSLPTKNTKVELQANSSGSNIGVDTENDTATIFVDISGAIEKPGIYELPRTARVADLLVVGGPILSDASARWVSQHLNLSAPLTDAQKLYIPFEWDFKPTAVLEVSALVTPLVSGTQTSTQPAGNSSSNSVVVPNTNSASTNSAPSSDDMTVNEANLINVNTASQSELESLDGIGKVYAQRMMENRPYTTIEELAAKASIPASTIAKIANFVTF